MLPLRLSDAPEARNCGDLRGCRGVGCGDWDHRYIAGFGSYQIAYCPGFRRLAFTARRTASILNLILPDINSAKPTMFLFSGRSPTPFRSVKLRSRRANCVACSLEREALKNQITSTDYIAFCGGAGENARIAGLKLGRDRIGAQVI